MTLPEQIAEWEEIAKKERWGDVLKFDKTFDPPTMRKILSALKTAYAALGRECACDTYEDDGEPIICWPCQARATIESILEGDAG